MTLIFKRSELAKDFITGGQETVGVRVPQHPIALALLKEFKKIGGKGVAAPSANRFGAVSPTTVEAVEEELSEHLGEKDLILDGGPSQVGVESTIIDCTSDNPKILRLGAITREMIKVVAGLAVTDTNGSAKIRVSGSLESHYSPKAKVIDNAPPAPGDGFIALESISTPNKVIRLASPKNIEEFASMLYSALRLGDREGLNRIVVEVPTGEGLAEAIRDRVKRATDK
jgi:L-threonylcarbamoyladenylate synthase